MDQPVTSLPMSEPPNRLAGTFQLAILLSCAGGYLDAFTWVAHGRVFANAQTGNVVLLGIDVATGDWTDAIHRLMPIVAFFFGVLAAYWVKSFASARDQGWISLISLGLEIAVLVAVAFLPGDFPSTPIVLAIAFVAAIQSSIFTKLDTWAYNSVIATGNLRKATEALLKGIGRKGDPASLEQAMKFGGVSLSFCVGAGLGAIGTSWAGNAATSVAALLLLLALVVCVKKTNLPWRGPLVHPRDRPSFIAVAVLHVSTGHGQACPERPGCGSACCLP